jgi:hypothetical protein
MIKISDKELWTKLNETQSTRTVQRAVSLPDGKELAHCMYLHPKYREVIDQLKAKLINTLEQDDQAREGFEEILENQGIKIQEIIKSDSNNQEFYH